MRQAAMSAASSASASPIASGTDGLMSWKEMREVKPSSGRLATVASCWATRTSLARVEMPMPTQIDQSARSGVKRIWASSCGGWKTTLLTTWAAPKRTRDQDDDVDRVGDRD